MDTVERTRFEVLLEDIQTQVKVIAEGHVALFAGQEAMRAELRGVNDRLDLFGIEQRVIKDDVKVLKDDVKVLKDDVKVLKDDVKVLKGDVRVLKGDMKAVKGDLNTLTADHNSFKDDTGRRLTRIEGHLKLNGEHRPRSASKPAKSPKSAGRKKS